MRFLYRTHQDRVLAVPQWAREKIVGPGARILDRQGRIAQRIGLLDGGYQHFHMETRRLMGNKQHR